MWHLFRLSAVAAVPRSRRTILAAFAMYIGKYSICNFKVVSHHTGRYTNIRVHTNTNTVAKEVLKAASEEKIKHSHTNLLQNLKGKTYFCGFHNMNCEKSSTYVVWSEFTRCSCSIHSAACICIPIPMYMSVCLSPFMLIYYGGSAWIRFRRTLRKPAGRKRMEITIYLYMNILYRYILRFWFWTSAGCEVNSNTTRIQIVHAYCRTSETFKVHYIIIKQKASMVY